MMLRERVYSAVSGLKLFVPLADIVMSLITLKARQPFITSVPDIEKNEMLHFSSPTLDDPSAIISSNLSSTFILLPIILASLFSSAASSGRP